MPTCNAIRRNGLECVAGAVCQGASEHGLSARSCPMARWSTIGGLGLFSLAVFGAPGSSAAQATADTLRHPQGAFVSINGANIWYESEGQGDPIILIAGGSRAKCATGCLRECRGPRVCQAALHARLAAGGRTWQAVPVLGAGGPVKRSKTERAGTHWRLGPQARRPCAALPTRPRPGAREHEDCPNRLELLIQERRGRATQD
jgi:hypothetical protein